MAAIFFAVAVASSLGGCPGSVEESPEPCTGTPTENGDGTTTIACLDGTKDLVCTNSDCTGVTAVLGIDPTITRVALDRVTDLDQLDLAESDRLQSVRLPSLRSVRSLSIRYNPALATVSLPALAALPGPSYGGAIFNNKALRTLVFPRLTSAEAGLYIAGNESLSTLSLPALAVVPCGSCCDDMGCYGGLYIAGNSALSELGLPALTMAGSLEVAGNAALSSVSLPALTTAVGTCACYSKPGRSRGGLFVIDNAAMRNLGVPAFAVAAELVVTGNAAYPQCRAEAVLSHLTSPPAYGSMISGNDTTATCTP